VVYHLYRSTGGPGLVLKTRAPREDTFVPSLVPVYPGAEFQERETWDLLGIRFEGPPFTAEKVYLAMLDAGIVK